MKSPSWVGDQRLGPYLERIEQIRKEDMSPLNAFTAWLTRASLGAGWAASLFCFSVFFDIT